MSRKLKGWTFSLALVLFGLVGLVPVSSVVYAQTTASQASLDGATQIQDCTKGCTFSTCQGNFCTVWYCDGAHGCIITGSYRIPTNVANTEPQIGPMAFKSFDDVAYVKTCSEDRCQLYEVTTTTATKVGYIENLDQILKLLRAKHEAGMG